MKDILLTTYRGAMDLLLIAGVCGITWGLLFSLGMVFGWLREHMGDTTFFSIFGVIGFLLISFISGLLRDA